MTFKSIVFDLDDTLYDHLLLFKNSIIQCFPELDISEIELIYKRFRHWSDMLVSVTCSMPSKYLFSSIILNLSSLLKSDSLSFCKSVCILTHSSVIFSNHIFTFITFKMKIIAWHRWHISLHRDFRMIIRF